MLRRQTFCPSGLATHPGKTGHILSKLPGVTLSSVSTLNLPGTSERKGVKTTFRTPFLSLSLLLHFFPPLYALSLTPSSPLLSSPSLS